jgi:photosynthetic reaction center cytochrome c subunit
MKLTIGATNRCYDRRMKLMKFALATALVALPLAAQQKNVKILKGMSDLQLQRTMNFMRASLGVHCDYCHVVTKETGWDFASDAKPEKETARKMINLVIDMNAKYFNGHTDVTCNSCHRGSTRPVAQPVLPQARPPFPTPKPERPPMPPRDEVVSKFAAAIGKVDESALANMSMKATRETSDGKSITVEYAQHDGTVSIVFPDQTETITPTGGVVHDAKGDRPMTASELENLNQLADAYRFILPRDIAANARVVGKDKIGDRDVFIVRSGATRFYFDAQSGLLLRRITTMPSPVGDIPMQTDYSDYRDVANMKLPFTIRVDSIDPWIGSTRKYTEIKVGASSTN